jgi:hypothetical protein
MYGTWCKALFNLENLTDKVWFNGHQHAPKLKLLLILEQGWNLGSMDQELCQCSPPTGTLCVRYYSNPYVPWECLLVPWFRVWGLSAFYPLPWAVERLNNFHRSFPASCSGSFLRFFCKFSKGWFKITQWCSQSRSRCIVLTMIGNWPSSSCFQGWYVEFIGRKSIAYLGYLCCRAKDWFTRDWYLIKSWSYGRYDVHGRGREWTHTWEILVFLFSSLDSQKLWRDMGLISFLLFFKDDLYSHG